MGRTLWVDTADALVATLDRPGGNDVFEGLPVDPEQVDPPFRGHARAVLADHATGEERRSDAGAQGDGGTRVVPVGRPEQPLPQQKGICIIEEPYRPRRSRQPGPQLLADISAVERFELAHAGEKGYPSVVIERPGDGYAPGRPGRRGKRLAAAQDALQQFSRRSRGPQGTPPHGAADNGTGA